MDANCIAPSDKAQIQQTHAQTHTFLASMLACENYPDHTECVRALTLTHCHGWQF